MPIFIIVASSLLVLAGFVAAIVFAAKGKLPESKGKRGESEVAKILGETEAGKQYVVNDLLFSDGERSCQIDHVLINPRGIWVVETKNYAGRICGTDDEREWTQFLGNGETVNRFYNPVKQNRTHVYRLKEALNAGNVFFNVVVFLDRADLTGVNSAHVCSLDTLSSIRTRETGISLSEQEMEGYYQKLTELARECPIGKREHVEKIRGMQDALTRGICPRCGGALVLRKGRNGEFYGCSNYPACRFSKDLE